MANDNDKFWVTNGSNKELKDLNTIAEILMKHNYGKDFHGELETMLAEIRNTNKVNAFLDALEPVFSDDTKIEKFQKQDFPNKTITMKTIVESLPSMDQQTRFIKMCSKLHKKLFADMFCEIDLKDPVARVRANNIISIDNFNNVIVECFKNNITEGSNEDKIKYMNQLTSFVNYYPNTLAVQNILNGKNETQLESLFKPLANVGNNVLYIATFPKELKNKFIDYLIKNDKLNFNNIASMDTKVEILEKASQENREKIVDKLTEEQKDELERYMSTKVNAKNVFKNTSKRVDAIQNEMVKLGGGLNAKGIKNQIKENKKNIKLSKKQIKRLNKLIAKDEKRLIRMAGFPEALDRIGFIENIRLKRFLKANKEYKDHLAALDKSEKELVTSEKNAEKLKEDLESSKERIRAQRDAMRREISSFRNKTSQIKNPERIKELLGREIPKKQDKVGKTVDNKTTQLAWAYIAKAHQTTGLDYKNLKVSEILTSNKDALGIVDDATLRSLISKIEMKLKADLSLRLDDEEFEQTISRHMGMSNYVLIIAVTALTVTGLIILLTMILS